VIPASRPAPRWVRVLTVAAVVVVAAVAAVASYAHTRALALSAGEGWRADLLPLSVDGLLVAASLVLLVRRRAGLPAGWLPWFGLALGVATSLAANVAAADPTILGRVVAAWPPLAFAVAFELLVIVLRDGTTAPSVDAQQSAGAPSTDGPGDPPPASVPVRLVTPWRPALPPWWPPGAQQVSRWAGPGWPASWASPSTEPAGCSPTSTPPGMRRATATGRG
jgi:hypothetical protein